MIAQGELVTVDGVKGDARALPNRSKETIAVGGGADMILRWHVKVDMIMGDSPIRTRRVTRLRLCSDNFQDFTSRSTGCWRLEARQSNTRLPIKADASAMLQAWRNPSFF